MARVAGPLMSLSASGSIGKAIVYSRWKGRPYVRTWVIPSNPRTGLQTGMRSGITAYPDLWNLHMDATQRALWNEGVEAEAISGFNLMTRVSQRHLRNNYAPCTNFLDQDASGTPAAPVGPAAAQDGRDMDITWTDEALGHYYLLFHSLTTPITANISNLIAITRQTLQLYIHRNPGIGTHYYDIRTGDADGGVGALAGEFSGTIS